MGNSNAKNSAQAVVNAAVGVTNNVLENCTANAGSIQNVECDASSASCPPGVVSSCVQSGINQEGSVVASLTCVQTASASSSVTQNVSQSVQQQATSVSTGFGLGNADASNVVDSAISAGTQISSNFQTILNEVCTNEQGVYAYNYCNTDQTQINQTTAANLTGSGSQTATIVNNVTQSLTQTISQKASAVNLGGLILVIIIIVIVIVIGYSLTKIETVAMQSFGKILIPLALLGGGYLGVAYAVKIWPFANKKPGPVQLQITPTTLPDITLGAAYSANLTVTGGTGPYTWSVIGSQSAAQISSLGLSLDNTGLLSGTVPSSINTTSGWPSSVSNPSSCTAASDCGGGSGYQCISSACVPLNTFITVYVTDSATPNANVGSQSYTIGIQPPASTFSARPAMRSLTASRY